MGHSFVVNTMLMARPLAMIDVMTVFESLGVNLHRFDSLHGPKNGHGLDIKSWLWFTCTRRYHQVKAVRPTRSSSGTLANSETRRYVSLHKQLITREYQILASQQVVQPIHLFSPHQLVVFRDR